MRRKRRQRAIQVAHKRGLGDLQFQPPGSKAGLEQDLMHRVGKIRIVDLHGRDIDRDGQRLGPGRRLAARRPQNPFADLKNDAGIFGNRNEFAR